MLNGHRTVKSTFHLIWCWIRLQIMSRNRENWCLSSRLFPGIEWIYGDESQLYRCVFVCSLGVFYFTVHSFEFILLYWIKKRWMFIRLSCDLWRNIKPWYSPYKYYEGRCQYNMSATMCTEISQNFRNVEIRLERWYCQEEHTF